MERARYILTSLLLLWLAAIKLQAQEANKLFVPDLTAAEGAEITVPVNLSNTNTDIVAMQFDLYVPREAMVTDLANIVLSERKDDHVVVTKQLSDGRYQVMVYSPANKPFKANAGEVLRLPARVPDAVDRDKVFSIELTNAVLSDSKGHNVLTESANGTFRIKRSPDFTVSNIRSSAATMMPGDTIDLTWTVNNIGQLSATGGWTERVFLVTENGGEKSLGTCYYDGPMLEAGGTAARSLRVALPALPGIDGGTNIRITVVPDADAGEDIAYQKNNTTETNGYPLTVGKRLYLTLPAAALAERGTRATRCTLARSGSWTAAQTFTLTKTAGDSRLSVPGTVTIPAGQSAAYFYLNVTNNDVLDADSLFTVEASGNGYDAATGTVNVEDDELPQLTVEASKTDIVEGESFSLTITTQRASKRPVTVSIAAEAPKRFSYPATTVIAAGETSVTVDVTAVDNDELELQESFAFTVSAERHVSGECLVMLDDNDLPAIDLDLTPGTVSEAAGLTAIVGKLRRTTNTDKKITVVLSDDSQGDIYYHTQRIVMDKGVEEVQFSLGVIDNAVVEGDRTVRLTAAVYVSSCNCSATGTSVGVVTKAIEITDNDGPSLGVTSSKSTLLEGNANGIVLTVTRNTSTEKALAVRISSNYDEGLQYEHNVEIPAGELQVKVPVTALPNSAQGDDRTLVFTVETDGYAKGTCWVMLTDQTLPDARVAAIGTSAAEAGVGDEVTVSVTVENIGAAELPEVTKVGLYLSNSSTPVANLYTQQLLAVGEQVTLTRSVKLPNSVGAYNIYAVVNDGRAVKELLYVNNTSEKVAVRTLPPFSATVTADKKTYQQGDAVKLSGHVTGKKALDAEVEVYVINNGLRQTIKATTDDKGDFTAVYQPYAAQMGHFTAGACYPGEGLKDEMAAFDIYGLKRASNAAITCDVLMGETYRNAFEIVNPGTLPLTGVKVSVLSKPENCDVQANVANAIEGGGTVNVDYALTGKSLSTENAWSEVKLMVETAEGASLPVTLYFYCRNPKGQLKAHVESIKTTMVKGATRDYPLYITNIGKGETGRITLSLPTWMQTATPREMASLAQGDTATVVLRFVPTDDMQLNVPVTGTIGINCENGNGIPLNYSIEPVSETVGTLTVDVCDEYTYYTAEAPHVAGAKVQVKHPTTGVVITEGVTGEDGLYSVSLPEGYYTIFVTADKHDSYTNNILVDPGTETKQTVNLSYPGIDIDFTVEEIEVEDVYNITTNVKYETNVPAPVVVLDVPSRIAADELKDGESLIFYATLTNKGLITAQDVSLILPENSKHLQFEALAHTDAPFDLAPQQSVTIPVQVTKVADSSINTNAQIKAKPIDDEPCVRGVSVLYFWECGKDRKWHRYSVGFQSGNCEKDDGTWEDFCNAFYGEIYWGGIGVVPHTGPGGYEDTKYNSILKDYSVNRPDMGCEPCQNSFMLDLIKCGSKFIPGLGNVFTTAEFVMDGVKCINSAQSSHDFVTKLKDCPFTKEFADIFGLLTPVYELSKDLVNGRYMIKDGMSSDTKVDIEALKKRLEQTTTDFLKKLAEKYEIPTDVPDDLWKLALRNKYPKVDEVMNRLEEVCNAYSNLTGIDVEKRNVANVAQATLVLFKSVGSLLEEAGLTKELGANMVTTVRKLSKYTCLLDLISYDCDKEGSSAKAKARSRRIEGLSNSAIDAFVEAAEHYVSVIGTSDIIRSEICGDSIWMDVTLNEFVPLYYYLTAVEEIPSSNLLYILKPENVSYKQFDAFVNRWNTIFNTENGYEGILDLERIKQQCKLVDESIDYLNTTECATLTELLQKRYDDVINDESINSVCASISLQFSQTMTMTRQAFRGTLTVFNGNEEKPMENVRLNLEIRDEDGKLATLPQMFQISAESLEGFTGELNLTDGWALAANETGKATILFIPTKNAAPETDKKYSFGGSLTYLDPFTGLEVTRDLYPVTLTVKPSPNLDLTYFMQRDIIGDDPLTKDVVEACEPAEFALLINNKGYGDATNVRMVTNQPEIIENEKGLFIDFEMLGTQLNGKDKTLALGESVATDFGTIPAHSTTYAQWWLQSSLLGHFTDYDVKATHVTSYGNEDLSLLDNVTIHELIHGFTVDAGADPQVRGFLVNDIVDAEDMPDMVYFTDGNDEAEVTQAANVIMQRRSDTEYIVTVTPAANGWCYGSTADLTTGRQKPVSVVRQSDGKDIPVDNFWQTDRTLRDGKDPLYEYRLHAVVQLSGEETYVLTFEPRPEKNLEVARFTGVPEEGTVLTEPLTSVGVVFNKEIDADTFTADDIVLNCQGVKVDLSEATIEMVSDREFTIGFGNATLESGYYVLTVQTAGITDAEGFAGAAGKSVSWLQNVEDTGIADNPSAGRAFTISPLPLRDVMYVDGDFSVMTKLVVVDVSGSIRISEMNVSRGSAIDVTSLPKGIYIVNVWTDNGKFIKKVLKK